jgi:hypothetical protein
VEIEQVRLRLVEVRAEQRWMQSILGWVRHRGTVHSREVEAAAERGVAGQQAVEVDAESERVAALEERLLRWLEEQERSISVLEAEEHWLAEADRAKSAELRHRLSVDAGRLPRAGDVRRRLKIAAAADIDEGLDEGFGPPDDPVGRWAESYPSTSSRGGYTPPPPGPSHGRSH